MNKKIMLTSLFFVILTHCVHASSLPLSSISDASITSLYSWTSNFLLLEIPEEKLLHSNDNVKTLFEQNNIIASSSIACTSENWNEEDWQNTWKCLIDRAKKQEEIINLCRKKIYFDEIPMLLQDAKSILKSFLPTEKINLQQSFICKGNACERLFTYAQLAKVIEGKKLSHVHLPLKILIIENKQTHENITDNQRASALLDDMIKVFVHIPFMLEAKIGYYSDNYTLKIFAEKKENSNKPFSREAFSDLKTLVAEAPFDIGFDNIFSDSNGDAVIIDTEYKGESAKNSLAKLERYKYET